MTRQTRRSTVPLLVIGVTAAAGACWLLRQTEEDRIVGRLQELAAAVQVEPGVERQALKARVGAGVSDVFAPDARVRIPDLPAASDGTAALARTVTELGQGYEEASVQLEQPVVQVGAPGDEARVNARALLSGRAAEGGLLTDTREVHIRLRKVDGRWRISELVAAPPSTVEPEPRP